MQIRRVKDKASLPPLRDAQKEEVMRMYAQKEREKPRLHPLKKNPKNDEYMEKYSVNVENEINKIKKQLEARRADEERRRVQREMKEKELSERELNRPPPADSKRYYNYSGANGGPNRDAEIFRGNPVKQKQDPVSSIIRSNNRELRAYAPKDISKESAFEKHLDGLNQVYGSKPPNHLAINRSPYRQVVSDSSHPSLKPVLERDNLYNPKVPDLFDKKSKAGRLPPMNQKMNEDYGKSSRLPPLSKNLEDLTPISYGKQKVREISKAYKLGGGAAPIDSDSIINSNRDRLYGLSNERREGKSRNPSSNDNYIDNNMNILKNYKNPQFIDSH